MCNKSVHPRCSSRCIDSSFLCDGDVDCPDGADEDASPTGPCGDCLFHSLKNI